MTRNHFIRINIAGTRFSLLRSDILRHPSTLLGQLATCSKVEAKKFDKAIYLDDDDEFFFNREPSAFKPILRCYQTGIVHRKSNACKKAFLEELSFWGLDNAIRCDDCWSEHAIALPVEPKHKISAVEAHNWHMESIAERSTDEEIEEKQEEYASTKYQRFRQECWSVLEPSGKPSKISFALKMFSILVILTNTIIIILDSIPEYRWSSSMSDNSDVLNKTDLANNTAVPNLSLIKLNGTRFAAEMVEQIAFIHTLQLVDQLCTIWFTIEFLARLWAAPNRLKFIKRPLTVIDMMAAFPYYIELLLTRLDNDTSTFSTARVRMSLRSFRLFRALRALRIFRMLKLVRYEQNFVVLGECLAKSVAEIGLLIVYLLIAALVFGTLIYYAEMDSVTSVYKNILIAAWWSMATQFGFAIQPPKTVVGRIIASIGALFGLILLAIVGILFARFMQNYEAKRKAQERKRKLLSSPPHYRRRRNSSEVSHQLSVDSMLSGRPSYQYKPQHKPHLLKASSLRETEHHMSKGNGFLAEEAVTKGDKLFNCEGSEYEAMSIDDKNVCAPPKTPPKNGKLFGLNLKSIVRPGTKSQSPTLQKQVGQDKFKNYNILTRNDFTLDKSGTEDNNVRA